MSTTQPAAAADGASATAADGVTGAAPAPVSIPALEAEISARRERLAKTLDLAAYADHIEEIGLEELPEAGGRILDGKINGRVLVRTR